MTNSQIRPYLCSVILSDDDGSKNNVKKTNVCKTTALHARTCITLFTFPWRHHVKLPHETCLRVEKFPFSFWTWQYGPSEFYSGKNHPRLTNWAGLNAMKFKKRELFFLPTFSLPSSLKLLELPRGGKLTNPLFKKLFLLSHLFPH